MTNNIKVYFLCFVLCYLIRFLCFSAMCSCPIGSPCFPIPVQEWGSVKCPIIIYDDERLSTSGEEHNERLSTSREELDERPSTSGEGHDERPSTSGEGPSGRLGIPSPDTDLSPEMAALVSTHFFWLDNNNLIKF